jgi:hypothetical protein
VLLRTKSQRRIPFSSSGASSAQAHSHGRLAPLSPAGRTSEKASFGSRSTYRSILFLRAPKGTALVLGTITA